MKKLLTLLLLVALLFAFSSVLMAQEGETEWKVVNYSLLDQDSISEGMADMIKDGYYPVGIEVLANRDLSVLFERIFSSSTSFYLHYFSDITNLSADFALFLQEGWAPSDVAFFNDGMFALFMQTAADMRGWRMSSVDGSTDAERQGNITRMVSESASEGYIPFGLSRFQDKLMIGFTTPHRSSHAGIEGSYRIEAYPNDGNSFVIGINERLEEGFHVAGYHFHSGQVYIAFLK